MLCCFCEKWINLLEISPFTHVHQKSQSYDVCFLRHRVTQTEFFFHFEPFFALLPPPHPNEPRNQICWKKKKILGDIILLYIHAYHKWRSYDVWFLKYKVWQKPLTFWAILCPFSPLTTPKIKILKLKKTTGDIIILHMCTKNDNHMMYGSWDVKCNELNFLSFWTVFCPFTP